MECVNLTAGEIPMTGDVVGFVTAGGDAYVLTGNLDPGFCKLVIERRDFKNETD